MKILVTGGAGYIGSHTAVELLQAGYEVVIVDDFSNSKPEVLERIRTITGRSFSFYQGNVSDRTVLEKVFQEHPIGAAIHFAGYKAVGESVREPLKYYRNNIMTSINLAETMADHGCHQLVFSSSATVYGDPARVPITEDFPLAATNPYGSTKLMIETILRDLHVSDPRWRIALLRYFNPVGAHPSGLIGEDPNGIPNNLMPYIAQVARGQLECLNVFGNDYPTADGTGVRDYIHVTDLAKGHLKALEKLVRDEGVHTYNLGTGKGYSVLEIVAAFQQASGQPIPYQIAPRRAGDIAICFADPGKAWRELEWRAEKGIAEMCADAWAFQG